MALSSDVTGRQESGCALLSLVSIRSYKIHVSECRGSVLEIKEVQRASEKPTFSFHHSTVLGSTESNHCPGFHKEISPVLCTSIIVL